MSPELLFLQTLALTLTSAALVMVCVRFGLPTVLGYLCAGIAAGPHGFALVSASDGVRFFGELGVMFLLFMIGLELSVPTVISAGWTVFALGGLQVAVTTAAVTAGAMALGFETRSAVIIGGVAAMSSTAVVLKQLADQGELSTPHGGLAVGILLFQDLAAVPFLVLVDAWAAGGEGDAVRIVTRLASGLVALAAVGSLARPLSKTLLGWVVRLRSNELMLLGTLAIAFGTAFLTQRLGLSPPIGAFLAGMAIGETDFRHQVEDDIRPFRDVLVGLFFVRVGMDIDVFAVGRAPQVVVILLAAFVAKGLFVTGLVRAFRWPMRVAVRTGACLMEGGEFGLLLVTVAVSQGILASSVGQACLVATVLSMGVAPLIVQKNERLGGLVSDSTALQHEGEGVMLHQSHRLENHVILLGCGRIGRLVAPVLEHARLPYIALEKDPDQFQLAKRRGHNVVLADGSRTRLLDAAGLKHARLAVITFDHRRPLERILHHARRENPALSTLVSARDDLELGSIIRAGATVVYPENLAAGLALASQALVLCGLSEDQASEFIKNTRAALNPELVVQGNV